MSIVISRFVAVVTSIFVWLGALTGMTETRQPVFGDAVTPDEKVVFDEGEFYFNSKDLVVSPDGDDANEGTLSSPLKTVKAAKEKLKALKGNVSDTVTVWFREGTYVFDETVEFTSSDLGNVIYRSYPGEKVVFSGSREISDWSETTINGVKAFVSDVEINSDEDYFKSLFKGNKRLSRSVYPKAGAFTVAGTKDADWIPSEFSPDYFKHALAFYANKNEILDFANASDVEVKIMHFWCDEHLPISSVDVKTGRVEVSMPSSMTIREDDNFVYENVREALSLPGEWYLDRTEQKLYYIPEDGDTVSNTVLSVGVTEQLFTFKNAENISFQGIDFINTDWDTVDGTFFSHLFTESFHLYDNIKYGAVHPQAAYETPAAIYIEASKEINFTDCLFENISYTAVKFDKGTTDCDITSCKFNEIGGNAVYINGDSVVPATTRNINVRDCHIGYYGRIFNNAIGILVIHAENCELSNNEIHDGWYTGISVGWVWGYAQNPTNGIKVKDNLIYNIGNGWLSDMGGIYTLGTQPDTVLSGNVIYNVGCYDGSTGYGGWGIYLDEGSSEITVEKNLVYDCSSNCFHQHYGRDNVVRNNIFAFGGDGNFIITRNEEHNSLYLTNNILVGEKTLMYYRTRDLDWFVDNANLYWDYHHGANVYSGNSWSFGDKSCMVNMVARGYYNNAVFADPLFKDAANRDFTLATNSPAFETGFEAWDYSNAGTLTLFE